jgi:hypothetical protein
MGRPEALIVAQRLYDAWKANDSVAAAEVATPYAVQHLFDRWSPKGSARPTVCVSHPQGLYGGTFACDAGPKESEVLFAVAVKGSTYVVVNVAGESCSSRGPGGTCYVFRDIDGG